MHIAETECRARSLRISITTDEGIEMGHCNLLLGRNDLHKKPFALLEDVFVGETWRGQGIGRRLVMAAIVRAKQEGAYKLIASVRAQKTHLIAWYESLGIKPAGTSLRMDL